MIIHNDKTLNAYQTASPMEPADFLGLAIRLTEMVYEAHQQTTFIGGLHPAHIIVQGDGEKAYLSANGAWHAAYRSPEQTSRLNRVPDRRSDLYVLGVILYELLTGLLPFRPEGDEDWDNAHIRMTPRPLSALRLEWGGTLEAILLKLLAKSPEDRYQSAYGLLDDWKRCAGVLQSDGRLLPFEIGVMDRIRSGRLPDALYGRSAELERLSAGLEQAANGLFAFRWVSGDEGSGKTSLIQSLQPDIAARDGRLLAGSADPSHPAKPFEPFLQALRHWIRELWSEPDDVIVRLKKRLHAEFGQEAETIVSMLPEAAPLFASQAEGNAVPDKETGARFGELLPKLLGCFAAAKPPLVLVLDHLEWADEDTLAVIRALASGDAIPGLFLIGACRTDLYCDGDDGRRVRVPDIPWLGERLRAYPEEQVALDPLSYTDVRQYVADALHEDSARVRLLARSVYHQTGGNPRALRVLLESWTKADKLSFDDKQRRWVWDAEVIRHMGDGQGGHGWMETGFAGLPDETKTMLAMAAAIGPAFRLSVLSEACELTLETTARLLCDAEAEGILCREDGAGTDGEHESLYMFLHDRLHRMAYAYDSNRNAWRHLKIGRALQRQLEWNDGTMAEAIEHLNLGVADMFAQERMQLAEYNMRAGRSAMEHGQYEQAKRYAKAGLQLVQDESEMATGALRFQLKLVLAWSEYMLGSIADAKRLLLDMKQHANQLDQAERSRLWASLIQFHTFDENEKAIQYGKEALAAYGWKLHENVSKWTVIKEVMHTQLVLKRKRGKLHQLPPSHDTEYATLSQHVERLFFPLLLYNAESMVDLYARFIRYAIQKGRTESLTGILCVYELLVQRKLPRFVQAVPDAEMQTAQASVETASGQQHILAFATGLSKQLEHPFEASVYLEKALRDGLERGEVTFANLAMITCLLTHNRDLYALSRLLEFFDKHMRQYANDKTLELVHIAGSYLAALQDASLQDSFVAIPVPHKEGEDNYGCLCKLEVAYLSGKYREALYWAKLARETELALDVARVWKQRLFETLTLTAMYPEANAEERSRIRNAVREQLRSMKKRKGYLGSGSSACLLVQAEWARIQGNDMGALSGYTAAAKRARAEAYGLMEGIACERIASYCESEMLSRAGAMIAAMDACTAYSAWGITSKAAQIRTEHADLFDLLSTPLDIPALGQARTEDRSNFRIPQPQQTGSGENGAAESGDALLRQIIACSGKPKKDNWLESFLEAALRQTGADRGYVLACRSGGVQIEAKLGQHEGEEDADLYAEHVLRHTIATGEPLLLHDAARSYFAKGRYMDMYRPRSILCMPIVVPGDRTFYALYLENRHVPDVFTDRDVRMLELIATRLMYFNMLEDEAAAAATAVPGAAKSRDTADAADTADTADHAHYRVSSATQAAESPLIEPLTRREIEIVAALAEGLSNKDIAERFGIAETTVKTHTSRIFGKLGVKRRGQAVVLAKKLQLLET